MMMAVRMRLLLARGPRSGDQQFIAGEFFTVILHFSFCLSVRSPIRLACIAWGTPRTSRMGVYGLGKEEILGEGSFTMLGWLFYVCWKHGVFIYGRPGSESRIDGLRSGLRRASVCLV